MALSRELEDELKCPIHLEFFRNPMSLRCRHIICKSDVDYMMPQNGHIRCPQCRTVSYPRDIEHDFRTQRHLDLHTADRPRVMEERVCGHCDDEKAISWCKQCHGYLGKRCERGHKKLRQHDIMI